MPKQTHEELLQMIRKVKEPTIEEILNLLQQSNSMPKLSVSSQVRGYGDYHPFSNELRLHPLGGNTNTVSHELSHALDNTMGRQWLADRSPRGNANDGSPATQQWIDGYTKLDPATHPLAQDVRKQEQYRGSGTELRAWGVGNMVDEGDTRELNRGYKGINPHLDATMATEAAILRELYKRRIQFLQNKKGP